MSEAGDRAYINKTSSWGFSSNSSECRTTVSPAQHKSGMYTKISQMISLFTHDVTTETMVSYHHGCLDDTLISIPF